ncbi:MAG: pantoate--beta-alanine ligase [Bacillota bacterium]|nr:pantoate--beta-alanine ligase [Thermoanaerobacteraceae bacterium]
MELFERIAAMRAYLAEARARGERIGFVPTMGFLHKGHLALIRSAREDDEVDRVVVSIFVNPLQFGPREDYRDYPRNLERDKKLCLSGGTDALFVPAVEEMYPEGFATHVEVTGVTDILCGRSRPGHFRGVATVVAKLFNIVQPDSAYFGIKDAQQVVVIRRMVEDLDFPVKIKVHPTVREEDGLAVSSRNIYLSAEERRAATVLYRSLKRAEELVVQGERNGLRLKRFLEDAIGAEPLARLDYAEVVSWPDLKPLNELRPGQVLLAVAAYFGRARLIDNLLVEVKA